MEMTEPEQHISLDTKRHRFSGAELRILKLLADDVFIPNQERILERWKDDHEDIDIYRVFSTEAFGNLCHRELARIVKALSSGDINAYLDRARATGSELAELRFSLALVPALVHALEDSYMPILFDVFRQDPDLAAIFLTMDVFLHDTLQEISSGYFDVMQERITQELMAGRILEEAFRPRAAPPIENLDIGVAYNSATQKTSVGGDFYDFFWLSNDRLAFAIGDVSGKGIEAASTAAMSKHMLRGFAQESAGPLETMQRLNRALKRVLADNEFVTAIYTVYEPRTGLFTVVGAGHPGPILRTEKGDTREEQPGGTVLGVTDDAVFYETKISLQPGKVLLFYTDGLIEARSGPHFYGSERASACLAGAPPSGAQMIVDRLIADCLEFTGGRLGDDVAVVCFKRRPLTSMD
jgi:hypothetical protein